jgi:O-succinylbenzoate synthase
MSLKIIYLKRKLRFKFQARTSRGVLAHHTAYFLLVQDPARPEAVGIGESAPLQGLSPEYGAAFERQLAAVCQFFNEGEKENVPGLPFLLEEMPELRHLPSVCFALETALADFSNGGKKLIFRNDFYGGGLGIPINGLIWMGDASFMRTQIREKLQQGYSCLKLKIGGLDFETECALLREIRQIAGPHELTIRLDANGAFPAAEALDRLLVLSRFHIHSLEQPIRPGQEEDMARLCAASPVPIALDEELIGVQGAAQKRKLVQTIQPAFLILKPTLLGGFASCREWIAVAGEEGVDWWITSALESNIGLNAISQFVAEFSNPLPQGLGTGQLYHNNVRSPLVIRNGSLWYGDHGEWERF